MVFISNIIKYDAWLFNLLTMLWTIEKQSTKTNYSNNLAKTKAYAY